MAGKGRDYRRQAIHAAYDAPTVRWRVRRSRRWRYPRCLWQRGDEPHSHPGLGRDPFTRRCGGYRRGDHCGHRLGVHGIRYRRRAADRRGRIRDRRHGNTSESGNLRPAEDLQTLSTRSARRGWRQSCESMAIRSYCAARTRTPRSNALPSIPLPGAASRACSSCRWRTTMHTLVRGPCWTCRSLPWTDRSTISPSTPWSSKTAREHTRRRSI